VKNLDQIVAVPGVDVLHVASSDLGQSMGNPPSTEVRRLMGEVVARIHAVVRRSQGHAQSVIKTGDITVNLDAKTVDANGARVYLTPKEYQMLELLALRKGTTITKEMFLNHLYDGMDEPELKIIDVFICKLRKKLAAATHGKHHIETIWGRGYVLRDPAKNDAAA